MSGKMKTGNNFARTYMPIFPKARERLQLRLLAPSPWRASVCWLGFSEDLDITTCGESQACPRLEPALGASGEARPPARAPAALP